MPRYRLLQARTAEEPVLAEERAAFAEKLGVPLETILPYDLLEGTASYADVTEGVDAVLVGGSGKFSIYHDDPWLAPFVETLGELAARQFPTFASCFGFQGLVVALGGRVQRDPLGSEVGSYELTLTDEGRADPLFGALPEPFVAQQGHKDRALDLPSGAVWLARSVRCPYQAIRVGEVVYATQFHPELSCDDNRLRFQRYFDDYSEVFGAAKAQEMLEAFRPSVDACGLLRRFGELTAS